MGKGLGIAIGLTAAAVSAGSFIRYYSQPAPSAEARLLENVGAYVQNSNEPVIDLTDYVRRTLEIAERDPRLKQDVGCLEDNLYRIGGCAMNSHNPQGHRSAIIGLGEKMECVASKENRGSGWLWSGGLTALLSAFFLWANARKD